MYHKSMPTTSSEDIRLNSEPSLSDNDLSLPRMKLGYTKSGRGEVNLGGRPLDTREELLFRKIINLLHLDSKEYSERIYKTAKILFNAYRLVHLGEDTIHGCVRTSDHDIGCSEGPSPQAQNSYVPNKHPFISTTEERDMDSFVDHIRKSDLQSLLSETPSTRSDLFRHLQQKGNSFEILYAILEILVVNEKFDMNFYLWKTHNVWCTSRVNGLSNCIHVQNLRSMLEIIFQKDIKRKDCSNLEQESKENTYPYMNAHDDNECRKEYDACILEEASGHPELHTIDACAQVFDVDFSSHLALLLIPYHMKTTYHYEDDLDSSKHSIESNNISDIQRVLLREIMQDLNAMIDMPELQQLYSSDQCRVIECREHMGTPINSRILPYYMHLFVEEAARVCKNEKASIRDTISVFLKGENQQTCIEQLEMMKHCPSGEHAIEALHVKFLEALIAGEEMEVFGNLIASVSDKLLVSDLLDIEETFNLRQTLHSKNEIFHVKCEYESFSLGEPLLLLQLCHIQMDKRIFSEIIMDCCPERVLHPGSCREIFLYDDTLKLLTSCLKDQSCTTCLLLNNSRKTGFSFINPFLILNQVDIVKVEEYTEKLVLHRKELFNRLPIRLHGLDVTRIFEDNGTIRPIHSILKSVFHDTKRKNYQPHLHLNTKIFISVSMEIINRGIINETDHLFMFKTDLISQFETHSIQICHHPKFRAIRYLLLESSTRHMIQKEDVSSVSRDDTVPRKTLIMPFSLQTHGKTNEQHYDSVCETHKIPLYTLKNENRNDIGKLLNESLMQIESMSLSKRFSSKSIMDLHISQLERQYIVCPVLRNCLDYTFEQIVAGANQHSPDIMRFEMQRFASFAKYNYPDTPSAFDFTKAGWYATGLGKETACFICNIKFSEWRKSFKPFDVHVQLSPECPFIKGEDVEAVNVDRAVHSNVNGHTNQSTRSAFESLTNGVEQINLTETNGSATCLQPHGFTYNTSSTPQNEYQVNGFSYSPYRDTHIIPPPILDQTDNFSNGHQLNGFRNPNGDSISNGQLSVDNPSRSSIHSEFLHDSSNGISSGHFNGHSRSHSDMPHYDNHLQQNNNHFVPFTADLLPQRPLPMDPTAPENDHGYLLPPPISVFSTPKFPAYHPLSVRISSYQGFPSHTGQSPRVLAQAGMFYRGYSDRCSCFWCGIGLQNWSMEDDPWVEHARWSPRCQYLIDAKGEEFIALVQESYRQEDPVFPELNDDDTMIAELQSIGFSTESIQSAIKTLKSNGRNVNLHIVANFILENMLTEPQAQANENNLLKSDPPSQIGKKEEPNIVKANNASSINNENSHDQTNSLDDKSKSMYEETTAMKEQLTCKVCMDKNVSVVFLPCGHIVACGVCSVRLSKCPICRKFIREKVKTLMS